MSTPIYDNMKNGNSEIDADTQPPVSQATPNVVIENANVRRVANVFLGVVGLILATVIVIDTSTDAFDLSAWTVPVFAGYAYLAGAFGLAVTTPNIPGKMGK